MCVNCVVKRGCNEATYDLHAKTQLVYQLLHWTWVQRGEYPTRWDLSVAELTDKSDLKIRLKWEKSAQKILLQKILVGYPTKNPPMELKGKS